MKQIVIDDLDAFLDALPPLLSEPLRQRSDRNELLEVVMDLGRPPEARFIRDDVMLNSREITEADIDYMVKRVGEFGGDNRAGIERTLHRISAIRNRKGRIVGLSCRVGRAVFGTIDFIRDLVESGKSILLLGRPGVGKTTMLREVARILAEDLKKRVVIVDTSNEIAGDGDIPHPAIGRARRMQVPTPSMQHAVMIEAVENHMPEVIVIDEIGTELEAQAARTIAERGVQLVATAHGNTLDNLMMNPTLADLIGGIHSVTLSDEEARRRGTRKSILERKAPPTFNVVVEIQSRERVAVHLDVASTVDAILTGQIIPSEVRWFEDGHLKVEKSAPFVPSTVSLSKRRPAAPPAGGNGHPRKIYPFGISRQHLEQAIAKLGLPVEVVRDIKVADLLMTSKSQYRRSSQMLAAAETKGTPIYVIRANKPLQMEQALANIYQVDKAEGPAGSQPPFDSVAMALQEVEQAIEEIKESGEMVELAPQNAFVRRLQHQLAEKYNVMSRSTGREPRRRVRLFKSDGEY